jgi:hypothetical protein
MTSDFETVRSSALTLGPAAKGYRGVVTIFEINGHRAALVTPDSTSLAALCRQWDIQAPMEHSAEPMVLISRFIVAQEDDLSDGLDDGLDDGLETTDAD